MTSSNIAWIDGSAGVSGDMLLGALIDLGADIRGAVAALGFGASLDIATTARGGLRALTVDVRSSGDQPLRTLDALTRAVDASGVPDVVAHRARAVLLRIAKAEARVHDTSVDEVHFHEIGAVDTVVDVAGVCLAVHQLGIDAVVVSPVALGGGTVDTLHGTLPVPGPAVLELLVSSALTAYGGPADVELATPTGVALLAELATSCGPMPAMRPTAVGIGAGLRELADRPNVVRVVLGSPTGDAATEGDGETWRVLEANVDDLDPRLWPQVIERLLVAGAADAWLTPILMKKGRPAHTVSALAPDARAEAVRSALFRESSTIGIRSTTVCKSALDRELLVVDVDGEQVRVKVARMAGEVVNVAPEWDDVAVAAQRLDRPAKVVLAAAAAAAVRELG
jgi:pyridinium-3,5-bisthiocarboxylic acid mononucleotide nickel chelatase